MRATEGRIRVAVLNRRTCGHNRKRHVFQLSLPKPRIKRSRLRIDLFSFRFLFLSETLFRPKASGIFPRLPRTWIDYVFPREIDKHIQQHICHFPALKDFAFSVHEYKLFFLERARLHGERL